MASIVIFLSIMISSMGTHRFIANLVHEPRVWSTWREKISELRATLTNRSFLALTISGVVGAISTGLRQGLDFYISAYFFELTPTQMSYLAMAALLAAFAGVVMGSGNLAAVRKEARDDRRLLRIPVRLHRADRDAPARVAAAQWDPRAVRNRARLHIHRGHSRAGSGFIIVSSMMADVVEDAAVASGQRSEGLLFAANGLISKCVTGVGTFLSSLLLAWVSFPQHAVPGQVDPAILHHLGMVFVPIVAIFSALAIAVLMFYDIDRSTHLRNVERLSAADTTPEPNGDRTGIRAAS